MSTMSEKGTNDHLHKEPRGYCGNRYCEEPRCLTVIPGPDRFCEEHKPVVGEGFGFVPTVADPRDICAMESCGRTKALGDIMCAPCRIQHPRPVSRAAKELHAAAHASSDPRMLGIGGAPTRATILPTDATARKRYPVASGVMDYFPDALAAISHLSWRGNEQHNPGQPLHWARGKSADEADTMMRHFLQRGTIDTDGQRHTVKMAWRALAILQKELEAEQCLSAKS
jgi:hypothetical protein